MIASVENKKIIVVDDDFAIRESVSKNLESIGLIVEAVENGANCLKKFEAGKIDVAIIDIGLPDIDGAVRIPGRN